MRNPNGYDSIVKLSGNRRRPYMARITEGFDERGYPIYNPLGYFEDRTDALLALAKYNECPYDIDLSKSSFTRLLLRMILYIKTILNSLNWVKKQM